MASYAWVETDLRCPTCSSPVGDLAWFIWGAVRSQNQAWGPTYRIGEQIMWFVDPDGLIPSDTVFPDGRCTNVGAPTRDTVEVWGDRGVPARCPQCDAALGGSVVTIVAGQIAVVEVVHDWPEGVLARRIQLDGTVMEEKDRQLRTMGSP